VDEPVRILVQNAESFFLYQISGTDWKWASLSSEFDKYCSITQMPVMCQSRPDISTLSTEKPQLLGIDGANVTGSLSAIRDAWTQSVSVRSPGLKRPSLVAPYRSSDLNAQLL
jgi:hypothetical protein